ncbi:hypothetical protein UlMin_025980 [Ulmus minor]
MEVTIISRETIKPSVPLHHLKPYKICLFDQLTPVTYVSVLLFYSIKDPTFNLPKTLAHLKKSLSETLTIYYPYSGITKNNLYIDEFDSGIPYAEARVNCTMSEFSKLKETELLNKFVLFHPFSKEKETVYPQIAFQVSIFACGGIALGTSFGHKKSDAASLKIFLQSWAAIFSGSYEKVIQPNFFQPASVFPPLTDMPENLLNVVDQLWFKESNYVTRRFIFNAEAVLALKAIGKSDRVPTPTRNEVVSCFIWKHAMAASWRISGTPRTSVAAHSVNFRQRMKSPSLENCTGNLFWWGAAAADPKKNIELQELVGLTRDIISGFDEELMEMMKGEEGLEPVSEFLNQSENMMSLDSEKPDIYAFTNWKSFFSDIDFGWGKPFWVGAHGKVGAEFRNLTVLVDAQEGKGVEAFITLEDKQMALLEKDPIFLAFASDPVTAAGAGYTSRL